MSCESDVLDTVPLLAEGHFYLSMEVVNRDKGLHILIYYNMNSQKKYYLHPRQEFLESHWPTIINKVC